MKNKRKISLFDGLSSRERGKKAGLKQSIASQNSEIQSRIRKLERERQRNLLQKALELRKQEYSAFVSKLNVSQARFLISELRRRISEEKKDKIKYEDLMQELAGRAYYLDAERKKQL
jgi:CRISPR/Cas system-associated endoribonuclease Cas2